MFAIEVIRRVDELRPNSVSADTKAKWLARCDGLIWDNLIKRHEGAHCMRPFMGETESEALYGEMMIDEPYAQVYEWYLMAQIDMANGDTDWYNNDMLKYNETLETFAKKWNREHRPVRSPKIRI